MQDQVEDFFIGLGYQVQKDQKWNQTTITSRWCNFLLKDHPARDMQDTFYITPEYLLYTNFQYKHVQWKVIHFAKGPLKMLSPMCIRRDNDDATQSHQFYQIEGLVLIKHITMSDLKGTLRHLPKKCSEKTVKSAPPKLLPFTEPSLEVG